MHPKASPNWLLEGQLSIRPTLQILRLGRRQVAVPVVQFCWKTYFYKEKLGGRGTSKRKLQLGDAKFHEEFC